KRGPLQARAASPLPYTRTPPGHRGWAGGGRGGIQCYPWVTNAAFSLSAGLRGWNVSEEEQFQALDWAFETGVAYSNMAYADGHLWIPQSGLYYVYSQVAFYLPSCQELRGWDARAAATVLTHNVYKRADSYPEPTVLLTATKSVCEGGTGDWHITISQGALFVLQERDSLFVTVNKVAMVVHVEQKTFFGAFML
ncbi:hypothetical protein chiPu_0022482, partial [Chiloscyllium punctatum]|nr:hypothetical protein [Chiloscyllium punctatum]